MSDDDKPKVKRITPEGEVEYEIGPAHMRAMGLQPPTDRAERDRLRVLCDALDRNEFGSYGNLAVACDPATIRALLDAAEERDRLHADHAITSATLNITIAERDALRAERDALKVEMHVYKSWSRDYDALRAVAEQAREALNEARLELCFVANALHKRDGSSKTESDMRHTETQCCDALAALDKALEGMP